MNTPDDDRHDEYLGEIQSPCSGCGELMYFLCLPSEREDIELGYRPRFCKECKKEGFRDG